jgi:hypothetical protein
VGVFVASKPGDRGASRVSTTTRRGAPLGEYSRGLPYDLMTFEERDQRDAKRTDAIQETVSNLPARPGT